MNERVTASLDNTTSRCPSCDEATVDVRIDRVDFQYGAGAAPETVHATLPVRVCRSCGFEYLDHDAEVIKHEAICRHLGRLTPSQIVEIRERYGLTRNNFASITKLGEATLGRWERGELIQNAANDQLLFLLTFPENLERLRTREDAPAPRPIGSVSARERFPSLARTRETAFSDPPFRLVVGQS